MLTQIAAIDFLIRKNGSILELEEHRPPVIATFIAFQSGAQKIVWHLITLT